MASYQPQHQPATRQRLSTNSLETSWFVTEISPATHENIFSDTLSSPLSSTRRSLSAAPDQEWEEQVLAVVFVAQSK
jgi:hypothetical protein